MNRGRRPAIATIGRAQLVNGEFVVFGWALDLCATRCPCHMHPLTGSLAIAQDQDRRHLGLVSYPIRNPRPCQCCQPWTAAELLQILEDLADIEAMQHQPPATPATS